MAVMIVIGVVYSVFWELEFSVEPGVDLTVSFYALKIFSLFGLHGKVPHSI